jgi:NAD(P)-dependent dehydrogenase (short-subunit alcohol dehydrogenase family)
MNELETKLAPLPLANKVAVVTGAARGLGRAFAHRLARLGADVAVLDIDLDGAAKFNEALNAASVPDEIRSSGRRSIGIQLDLGRRAEVIAAMDRVRDELGGIDVLVNNAGGFFTPMEGSAASNFSQQDFQALFEGNFQSTVNCCQQVVPGMRERGGGVIVNISSQSGVSVYPGGHMAAYAVAKAAVSHYTRYLATEVGPWGIRANCLAPGIMLTARVAHQAQLRGVGTDAQAKAIPLRRLGVPDDCAGVLEFLVTDLSRYVTGQCICVDGGVVLTPS